MKGRPSICAVNLGRCRRRTIGSSVGVSQGGLSTIWGGHTVDRGLGLGVFLWVARPCRYPRLLAREDGALRKGGVGICW